MLFKRKAFLILLLFLSANASFAANPGKGGLISSISFLEDEAGNLKLDEVIKKSFTNLPTSTPNFGLTKSVYWLKVTVNNNTSDTGYILKIHNGTLTETKFYTILNNKINIQTLRDTTPFRKRIIQSQYPLFKIHQPHSSSITYYLRIRSNNVLDIPISVGKQLDVFEEVNLDQLYFGIYAGIILIMFLYNIFIYITVRDVNYLYYVFYILIIGLTQASLKGFGAKFFWQDNSWLIWQAPNLFIALSGIFSILFVVNFLQLKKYANILFYVLVFMSLLYVAGIFITLSNNFIIAQQLLQVTAGLVAATILISGLFVLRKGYQPALFFNFSWSFFLIGVIIYLLKDAGILPYNNFTGNAILIGSGIEVALLSFALADRINTYKKEKEESQAQALLIAKENERIIREQNIILETKVHERTLELRVANEDLNKAMKELKEAEGHLVESEKMASLGQLTAGIAHEINNPINFVTSNVTPLKRDVDILLEVINTFENVALSEEVVASKRNQIEKYKEEIDFDYLKIEINHLIKGIGEGASRTAEIVKGLRVFSRVDEDDLKKADINDGLNSTLVITNNLMRNVELVKEYAEIPVIECYPGKLNQVFLNIISNAVHAINKKFGDNPGGILKIITEKGENFIRIKINDNGTGMDENTKRKIFEPFFTTKEVGEGTGLGMSIAYNIIKKHNGNISIKSTLAVGTEFTLEVPLIHKI